MTRGPRFAQASQIIAKRMARKIVGGAKRKRAPHLCSRRGAMGGTTRALFCARYAGMPSADDDFADLHDRRDVGVVLDVAHDLLGVRSEGGLVRLDRVAEDVTHADIGRGRAGSAAAETLVDRIGLARIAHAGLQEWQVLFLVILLVEAGPWRVRIHYAYLDHGLHLVLNSVDVRLNFAGWSPALLQT